MRRIPPERAPQPQPLPTLCTACGAPLRQALAHLWDLLVQRVLPDPPAQAVRAPPRGLPGLEARLSRGVPGAQVCLAMPSCVLGASGPGGGQVWLWRRTSRAMS